MRQGGFLADLIIKQIILLMPCTHHFLMLIRKNNPQYYKTFND
jgi:hypothetical protein